MQLKTEDEENDPELRDTNGKTDGNKNDDMTTEQTTTITENGSEILMTVVAKAEGMDTSPSPANHQQVFWIQSGTNPPPQSLYTIKQLNYSQVAIFFSFFAIFSWNFDFLLFLS